MIPFAIRPHHISSCADGLVEQCFGASFAAGWHHEPITGERVKPIPVPTKLMLTVSELGEAMEGHRKSLQDEHLRQYPSLLVELADALIRVCDLAGVLLDDPEFVQKFSLGSTTFGEIVAAKMLYNADRQDHKIEARLAGGKAY